MTDARETTADPNSHFSRCRARVLGHADDLVDRIKAGHLNASAFEGLMRSFLEQPAYYPEWRRLLLDLALTRHDGIER